MGLFDEVLAGGASFELAKKYEEHNNPQGKHAFLKEMAAALTGAEGEKLIREHGPEVYHKLREQFNHKAQNHDDINAIEMSQN